MKVPDLSLGILIGVSKWVPTIQVNAVASGTLGVGTGLAPLVVPAPLLTTSFLPVFAANGIFGVFSPLFVAGLSTGLNLVFLQGICRTTHPNVGIGAGVVRFIAPPATPFLIEGLASVGMVGPGPAKLANAIGQGLGIAFSTLVLPCVVAGSPSPVASAGVGFGQIV